MRLVPIIAVLAATSLALVSVQPALGQELASLRTGERVRISVAPFPAPRVQGRLVSFSTDTIVVSHEQAREPVAFSNVRLLEVKRRSGASFLRSAAFGLLGGVVGGAILGAAQGNIDTGDGTLTTGDNAIIGSILGGGAGFIGGLVFGVCCSSNWRAVALPR